MEPVTAILALVPVAMDVEAGIQQLIHLTATLRMAGKLSDEDVAKIQSDAGFADSEYDAAITAAKKRLSGE